VGLHIIKWYSGKTHKEVLSRPRWIKHRLPVIH
jgi:hypothetical protein